MSPAPDIVILGSGTTAFAGALRAAGMGARVVMVEKGQLGGTCVNWGCIPSKTLIEKAADNYTARRAPSSGLDLKAGAPDCARLMEVKRRAVATLRREHYQEILENEPDIDILRGHGRFISARQLCVGDDVLTCDRFLIASGGVPRVLDLPGLADIDYLTSYSAMHLSCFPESLIIIGGGVIALEMGQMFSRFGTRVTILERSSELLGGFDPRLTRLLRSILAEEGVELLFGAESLAVHKEESGVALQARIGPDKRTLRAQRLMLAVGTAPATDAIGLREAGVETDAGGFIRVDREMRTSAEGIWAAGDVTGGPLIAPAGALEAETAVDNMLRPRTCRQVDHRYTPMGIFVDPEFATVGITADAARKEGLEVVESWLDLREVAKAHVMGRCEGGIVLCAQKGTGRILGLQMLAPRAADIVHEAALAVRFGLSVYDLAETVHVYPTLSEGLRLAALENIRQQPAPSDPPRSA